METLNLVEILRGCPVGTPLYSPLFGEVSLKKVWTSFCGYPIEVRVMHADGHGDDKEFTVDGRYWGDYDNSECVLFPSKDCRDWSQFRMPEPKQEPKPEPKRAFNFFRPFDKVLVRDDENCNWEVDFFDHYNQNNDFPYRVMTSGYRKYCIPYEGNEHLHPAWNKPNE